MFIYKIRSHPLGFLATYICDKCLDRSSLIEYDPATRTLRTFKDKILLADIETRGITYMAVYKTDTCFYEEIKRLFEGNRVVYDGLFVEYRGNILFTGIMYIPLPGKVFSNTADIVIIPTSSPRIIKRYIDELDFGILEVPNFAYAGLYAGIIENYAEFIYELAKARGYIEIKEYKGRKYKTISKRFWEKYASILAKDVYLDIVGYVIKPTTIAFKGSFESIPKDLLVKMTIILKIAREYAHYGKKAFPIFYEILKNYKAIGYEITINPQRKNAIDFFLIINIDYEEDERALPFVRFDGKEYVKLYSWEENPFIRVPEITIEGTTFRLPEGKYIRFNSYEVFEKGKNGILPAMLEHVNVDKAYYVMIEKQSETAGCCKQIKDLFRGKYFPSSLSPHVFF